MPEKSKTDEIWRGLKCSQWILHEFRAILFQLPHFAHEKSFQAVAASMQEVMHNENSLKRNSTLWAFSDYQASAHARGSGKYLPQSILHMQNVFLDVFNEKLWQQWAL